LRRLQTNGVPAGNRRFGGNEDFISAGHLERPESATDRSQSLANVIEM
jgi:hypothetical protein